MKKFDFVLAACLLAAGIGMFALFGDTGAGTFVEIYSDGVLYGKYPLHEDRTVRVVSAFGQNTVKVKNGEVFVSDSSCKDGLEMKTGAVKKSGESLVCLPNRLVVSVVGGKDAGKESVDSVSY